MSWGRPRLRRRHRRRQAGSGNRSRYQHVFLVGNEAEIRRARETAGLRDSRIEVVHASEVLTMDDKPLEGIRRKKDSSMVRAIELSATERPMPSFPRQHRRPRRRLSQTAPARWYRNVPPWRPRMPSRTNDFVLIDAGASPVCEPTHLAQFAVMGSIYAREIIGHKNPRVGILSNGSEESKGNELTRIRRPPLLPAGLNFIGYVEGFDLFNDAVEVVVADGFTETWCSKPPKASATRWSSSSGANWQQPPCANSGALLARSASATSNNASIRSLRGAVLLASMASS